MNQIWSENLYHYSFSTLHTVPKMKCLNERWKMLKKQHKLCSVYTTWFSKLSVHCSFHTAWLFWVSWRFLQEESQTAISKNIHEKWCKTRLLPLKFPLLFILLSHWVQVTADMISSQNALQTARLWVADTLALLLDCIFHNWHHAIVTCIKMSTDLCQISSFCKQSPEIVGK